MSTLMEIRRHGYDATLLASGELKVFLPKGVEKTKEFDVKLSARLKEIKPILIAELRAEQDFQGGLYRFSDYTTRKDKHRKGRLVLELVSNDTGELIHAYFNVNITYQRGHMKGEYFKTGHHGRFWILPRSKFAAFWINTIGQPERWSTVYRQMNHLKQFEFSGIEVQAETYKQLTDIRAVRKCR